MHEHNTICSKLANGREQTIIISQLFVGHMVGSQNK